MVAPTRQLVIKGARQHNLKNLTISMPKDSLVVVTGPSGAGKSSLVFDTLYAEGQRYYMETLTPATRQMFAQLEHPDVDSIEGLTPTIAVQDMKASTNPRATVGTASDIQSFLRVLFTLGGTHFCPHCDTEMLSHTIEQATQAIMDDISADGTDLLICAPLHWKNEQAVQQGVNRLRKTGFVRLRIGGEQVLIDSGSTTEVIEHLQGLLNFSPDNKTQRETPAVSTQLVIDRLRLNKKNLTPETVQRISEAVELAMGEGEGCTEVVFVSRDFSKNPAKNPAEVFTEVSTEKFAKNPPIKPAEKSSKEASTQVEQSASAAVSNMRLAKTHYFYRKPYCSRCHLSANQLNNQHFSFNHPEGACSVCHGIGSSWHIDEDALVSDKSRSIREGAILSILYPRWKKLRGALALLCEIHHIPSNEPWKDLTQKQKNLILNGDSNTPGAISVLEGRIHQVKRDGSIQDQLKLGDACYWSHCFKCSGSRYQPETLQIYLVNRRPPLQSDKTSVKDKHPITKKEALKRQNIAGMSNMSLAELAQWLKNLQLSPHVQEVIHSPLQAVQTRLQFMCSLGLQYLTLYRSMDSLSVGERRRVQLASQLGSPLSGITYVLDEPSSGLHPCDVHTLLTALTALRKRGNMLIAVEHNLQLMQAADYLIELGPEAGEKGGYLIASGAINALQANEQSQTGYWLNHITNAEAIAESSTQIAHKGHANSSKASLLKASSPKANTPKITSAHAQPIQPKNAPSNVISLIEPTAHHLKMKVLDIPLGMLVGIAGVSGSGKSAVLFDVLEPALQRHIKGLSLRSLPLKSITLTTQIERVVMLDPKPPMRSSRANAATYLGFFVMLRSLLSEVPEARKRGYAPSRFSFNVPGGRCETCLGEGLQHVAMQFMPAAVVRCHTCQGTRFQASTLEITYKGHHIANFLELTLEEAAHFFRHIPAIQRCIAPALQIGLGYLKTGQPMDTLSGGEIQRLKIAHELNQPHSTHTLYLLDEPSRGLYFSDVKCLLGVLQQLVAKGHSVVMAEHNRVLLAAMDHLIELGPGSGPDGGLIMEKGTPQALHNSAHSAIGPYLNPVLYSN